MTFQVLPVSGWVGNAIRVSCLEPGNVEGMGNKDDSQTQCGINRWSIPLSQPFSLCVRREKHHHYQMLFGFTRACEKTRSSVGRLGGWELLVSSMKPVALKSVLC